MNWRDAQDFGNFRPEVPGKNSAGVKYPSDLEVLYTERKVVWVF